MTHEEALGLAAQAWCTPETEKIEMDSRLAKAFAEILKREVDERVGRLDTKIEVLRRYLATFGEPAPIEGPRHYHPARADIAWADVSRFLCELGSWEV